MKDDGREDWREVVLGTLLETEERVCPWDELHVAANGDPAELERAEAAVKELEAEGLVYTDGEGVIRPCDGAVLEESGDGGTVARRP